MLQNDTLLRDTLEQNNAYFKKDIGFNTIDEESAIVPVILYHAKLSQQMANRLLERVIYVIEFFYPVVSEEKARISVQPSATLQKNI